MISYDVHATRGDFTLHAQWESPHSGVGIFGPSGSGKTTLLYALAGLFKPDSGRIRVGSEVWFDSEAGIFLPPQERKVGFVFQDSRLFPHLSVEENLLAGAERARSQQLLEEVLARFQLAPLVSRRVGELSGGEIKRVALGRALLRQPRLLILDEPLTGLHAALQRTVLGYLLNLGETLQIPVLTVSHRFSELLNLSDWIVFLKDGRVTHQDSAQRALAYTEEEDAVESTLLGTLCAHEDANSVVDCDGLLLRAPRIEASMGDGVFVTVKAEDCVVARGSLPPTSARNTFSAEVVDLVNREGRVFLRLDAGPIFWAELTPRSVAELKIETGSQVTVLLKVRSLRASVQS